MRGLMTPIDFKNSCCCGAVVKPIRSRKACNNHYCQQHHGYFANCTQFWAPSTHMNANLGPVITEERSDFAQAFKFGHGASNWWPLGDLLSPFNAITIDSQNCVSPPCECSNPAVLARAVASGQTNCPTWQWIELAELFTVGIRSPELRRQDTQICCKPEFSLANSSPFASARWQLRASFFQFGSNLPYTVFNYSKLKREFVLTIYTLTQIAIDFCPSQLIVVHNWELFVLFYFLTWDKSGWIIDELG